MTQEEKDLLLKDLCARLPYEVKCQVQEDEFTYIGTLCRLEVDSKNGNLLDFAESMSGLDCQVYLSEVKPYLFPLSSMTEEQKKYVTDRWGINENFDFEIDPNWGKYFIELGDVVGFINWCYENHLDINGLIPKGLSIDATGLNIYINYGIYTTMFYKKKYS